MQNRWRVEHLLALAVVASLGADTGVNAQTQQTPTPERATILRGGTSRSSPTAKELDDAATPIVDLGSARVQPSSDARILQNKRFDHQGRVRKDPDPRVAAVMLQPPNGDIPDMPIRESDLVIEGTVTASAAFLANDNASVYSEFTVHITDILKEGPGLTARTGASVVAERFGGRVRYPGGRLVRYGFVGYGSPAEGKKYLLFLAATGAGNYTILTGYEIRGQVVRALDGARITERGRGQWSCDKHNEEGYHAFRVEVDQAIRNPPPRVARFNP
jgi:hypothetical protein